MVFVEGDDYRALQRPGDDPARFRSPVRFGAVPSSAVVDGLVAWYRFEDSTNTAIDATNALGVGANQTAFDGTVNGASFVPNDGVTDVVSGPNSGAYDFDGTDDEINAGPSPSLSPNRITISCFVKPDDVSTRQQIIARDRQNNRDYQLQIAGLVGAQNILFTLFPADEIGTSSAPLSTGIYTHVVATYDGSELALYIDGQKIKSKNNVFTPNTNSTDTKIGSRVFSGGKDFFDGSLDDVRIYNRALSASEINQIYTNTDPDQ
jgi:hypothetical protein